MNPITIFPDLTNNQTFLRAQEPTINLSVSYLNIFVVFESFKMY